MPGERKALIVGVSDYPVDRDKLKAVAEDLREVTELLESPDGAFNKKFVHVLADAAATRDRILLTVTDILGTASPEDTIFLYFAGHGCTLNNQYFFVPHDFKINSPLTLVPVADIRDAFQSSPCQRLFMWLDFCHSGGIVGRSIEAELSDVPAVLKRSLHVTGGTGKAIMAACTASQLAYEGGPGSHHGHFTEYLLQGLRGDAVNANGEVTASSLFDYIDNKMGSDHQRPVFEGSMTGRIVLMHYRDRSAKQKDAKVAAAATSLKGTLANVHDFESIFANSSGNLIFLNDRFFRTSRAIREAGNVLQFHISSTDSSIDASIRSLEPDHFQRNREVAFAYRNEAHRVRVLKIEGETQDEQWLWKVSLSPIVRAGNPMEVGLQLDSHNFSADHIAELRARRILLDEKLAERFAFNSLSMSGPGTMAALESYVSGGPTSRTKSERSPISLLWEGQRPTAHNVLEYLETARLASIMHLHLSDTIEHVLELILGPFTDQGLRVTFRGQRWKYFANQPPPIIEFEGHCPLAGWPYSPTTAPS